MAAQKKKTETKRLMLLDMHAILHRAYHALPDFSTSDGTPTGALYGLCTMLIKAVGDLKPDYIVAAYDLPKPTHRHEAFADYKAGRMKTDDALVAQLESSREVLTAFNIPWYEHEGFEADDVLGTIVETMKDNEEIEIVIVSGDMDTLQLVDKEKVKVFTLRKGMNDTVLYGHKEVVTRFGFGPELLPDFKGLRGDPSDNIPGIRGVGEKTATEIITTFGTIEKLYETIEKKPDALEKAGVKNRMRELITTGKEDALFSKILATIRRDAPINFVLPEKPWKESVAPDALTALFVKLEFRTLGARVKTMLGTTTDDPSTSSGRAANNQPTHAEASAGTQPTTEKSLVPSPQNLAPAEFEEAKIALWLLNSDLTNPNEEDILSYTKAQTLADARTKLFAELEKEKLMSVFEEIEKPLIPVLAQMKEIGVKIDAEYLDKLAKDYHTQLSKLEKSIYKHVGKEFNINSPRQLGDMLFGELGLKGGKKTATGQRSTKESELEKLKDAHPIIKDILAYRELQKLLSTYIDAFPKMLGDDGRLHTTFIQTGAATGRMSSQAPNLQNIPIRTELGRAVRGAFVAEKGFELCALDYSQIELRLAAIMSGDEKMIKTFSEGGDIHTAVASEMFGIEASEVTSDMRRTAKVINFGILYGMGANALAATAEVSRADAQKYLADYVNTFTGLTEYMSTVRGEARTKGYTTTLFGRRRKLTGLRSPLPYIRAEAERQAVNAPIQGSSADITKLAMIEVDKEIVQQYPNDVRAVLQIHDELIYEVREGLVDTVVPQIKSIMEKVLPNDKCNGVPIIVDAAVGKRWSELERHESGKSSSDK